MDSHTGGGASVGGNVDADDFTGRDYRDNRDSSINIKLGESQQQRQHRREQLTVEDRIRDVERYLYGDQRAGEPGLIMRTRIQLRWSQVNTAILIVIFILLLFRLAG